MSLEPETLPSGAVPGAAPRPSGTVIALGGNPGGLEIVRSLGRRGIRVLVMTHRPGDVARASRYAREVIDCPHPGRERDFADFLLKHAEWHGALILESDDYFSVALSKHKQELAPHYLIITQDWDRLRLFVEKSNTYAFADTCGVPHPGSFLATDLADRDSILRDVSLPCILKPVHSHRFVERFSAKLLRISSPEELEQKLSLCLEEDLAVMVQEIVPGPEENLVQEKLYVDTRGRVAACLQYRKIRQNPPLFGNIRAGRSVPLVPEVHEHALGMVRALGYVGYIGIEFKLDERDGRYKLIEVNNRVGRCTSLLTASGVDLPWLIYRDLVEGEPLHVDGYREAVWIDMLPDLFSALVRDGAHRPSPGALLRPYLARNRSFAVFSWRDPLPFLKQLAGLPRHVRREFQRRLVTR